jgi:hemoglobin-like flavoprotein
MALTKASERATATQEKAMIAKAKSIESSKKASIATMAAFESDENYSGPQDALNFESLESLPSEPPFVVAAPKPPPAPLLSAWKRHKLRQSWALVESAGTEAVGVLLFEKIFEAAPWAIKLFSFDGVDLAQLSESRHFRKHAQAVVEGVGAVVAELGDTGALLRQLRRLGRRHARMGLAAAHFDLVGACLISTLEQGLGDAFTTELRELWVVAYHLVSTTMQEGMGATSNESFMAL